MTERGKHTVRGQAAGSQPRKDSRVSGEAVIAWIFWLVVMPVLFFNWIHEASHEGQNVYPPAPPRSKVAVFRSTDVNAPPLSIVIGGGTSSVEYRPIDPQQNGEINLLPQNTTFYANFATGETRGDPKTATDFVLIGAGLEVDIGNISGSDVLNAGFINYHKLVNAYFNYENSERGPPASHRNYTVYVCGDVESFNFLGGHRDSQTKVTVLELDPTDHDIQVYNEAVVSYRSRYGTDKPTRDQSRVEHAPRVAPHGI